MATPTRRSNDLPTAVMLATDSALCPSARVASTSRKSTSDAAGDMAHRHTTTASSERQDDGGAAKTDAIEHAADWQADRGTEERRPQVDVGVRDAVELQIAQHRLGDETEPLCPPWQRRQHDDRRDDDVHPAAPFGRPPARRETEIGVYGRSAAGSHGDASSDAAGAQNRTPAPKLMVRGAPISPTKPDGAKSG